MLVLLGKNKKTMRSCFNWDSSLLEYAWFMRGKRETLRGLASSGKDTCLSLPARDFSLSFSVSFTDSYCFHLYWLSSPWEVRRNGALTVFVQCGKEEVKIHRAWASGKVRLGFRSLDFLRNDSLVDGSHQLGKSTAVARVSRCRAEPMFIYLHYIARVEIWYAADSVE